MTDKNLYKVLLQQPDWIGRAVIHQAFYFFEECPEDFGIQHESYPVIIFGGTNRVVWSVRFGFRIDESYCTSRFIEHFKEQMN